jgi:hypothetical protein
MNRTEHLAYSKALHDVRLRLTLHYMYRYVHDDGRLHVVPSNLAPLIQCTLG